MDLLDVEKDGVTGANVDPADVHVLVEAGAIATSDRGYDTERFIVALGQVVEVIDDVDGEFVFEVI